MLMNEFMRTRLFSLLATSSPVENEKMQSAYENFMKEVSTLNQAESDYRTIYRTLSMTRIELQSLQTQFLYEQGKKCT